MTMREQISDFLNEYKEFMSLEDLYFFLKSADYLELYENTEMVSSVNGEHFKDCPWSDDSCREGPDTCHCMSYRYRTDCVNHLINLYHKHVNF